MLLDQAPDNLASVTIVHGVSLAATIPPLLLDVASGGTPDVGAIATEMAEPSEMPPVVMALLGATTGGPLDGGGLSVPPGTPDARAVAVLLMLSSEAAVAALPVIEERLATGESAATGEPYATMFPQWTVEAAPEALAVLVELTLGEDVRPNILLNMLFPRDLGFLAW